MIYLTRRQWQFLQWLEKRGPIGSWVGSDGSLRRDLNISASHMVKLRRELEEVDVIESRKFNNRGSREVRVLIPFADPRIVAVQGRKRGSDVLAQLCREKPKKLIRYAGWEPQSGWVW